MISSSADLSHLRLIVFGCGYVGTAVVAEARRRGWRVAALTRSMAHAQRLESMGVPVVVADLAESGWHGSFPAGASCVLNCVSSGGGGLGGYWHSYVEGTKSILAWVRGLGRGHGCGTYVQTGSTSVYPQNHGEVVAEDAPVGDGSQASVPLLEAERLVREGAAFQRWFILRLSGIYGPGRHFLLDQLRAGATVFPGTGAHRLNLVHRDDIVSAIFACFEAPAGIGNDTFNVSGENPPTKQEFSAWLAAQIGVAAPAFERDQPSRAGTAVPRVRGRSGPVPDRVISSDRIRRVLGWRPMFPDFRAGYRAILAAERAGRDAPRAT